MNLTFDTSLVEGYKSKSQIARILTEDWLAHHMYCPICGETSLQRAEPNAPVKDYMCASCRAQYELKSQKVESERFQSKVPDGTYHTMIERIRSFDNPHFFFMHYNRYEVNNLILVPNYFFTPHVIECRKPLSSDAQRSGWKGCNILLGSIPSTAKISIIRNGVATPSKEVIAQYHKLYALQVQSLTKREWLMDVLHLVERMEDVFTLSQLYAFANELQQKHPHNHHIPDKIRQQLQLLRDKGIIEFRGRGIYQKVKC